MHSGDHKGFGASGDAKQMIYLTLFERVLEAEK